MRLVCPRRIAVLIPEQASVANLRDGRAVAQSASEVVVMELVPLCDTWEARLGEIGYDGGD